MSLPPLSQIRALIFDYGNTLIEFSSRQIVYSGQKLAAHLQHTFGPFDQQRFDALREAGRMAPYQSGYRENSLHDLSFALVKELYGREPSATELAGMLALREQAFVESIEAEPEVLLLLGRLAQRFALGLLSNYPSGAAIRRSLGATGIAAHLSATVVSGEVGFVKPHPAMFQSMVETLGIQPAQAIHIGDNWLADVQGAKRAGMACIQVRRWPSPEPFEEQPGDHQPDAVILHLSELEELLLVGGARARVEA